jgi:hypothetical protein
VTECRFYKFTSFCLFCFHIDYRTKIGADGQEDIGDEVSSFETTGILITVSVRVYSL